MKASITCSCCVFLLLCFQASAISVPAPASFTQAAVEDSTLHKRAVLSAIPAKGIKAGIWEKLKNELQTLLLKRQGDATAKASTKSTLGWVSLGMIVLSIGLLAFASGGGGAGVGLLFLAGLLGGLVSLLLPRGKADKAQNKKSNTGAIIGLSLGIGLVVALVIIFAGSSWH